MKMSSKEVKELRDRMEHILATSDNQLQRVLAQYWLDEIKVRGKYALVPTK